jgi:hypothetical protein
MKEKEEKVTTKALHTRFQYHPAPFLFTWLRSTIMNGTLFLQVSMMLEQVASCKFPEQVIQYSKFENKMTIILKLNMH